jgi:hypothetical protein
MNRFFSIGLVALTLLCLQHRKDDPFVANMNGIDAVNTKEDLATATRKAQHKATLSRAVTTDEANSQKRISANQKSQEAFNYTHCVLGTSHTV